MCRRIEDHPFSLPNNLHSSFHKISQHMRGPSLSGGGPTVFSSSYLLSKNMTRVPPLIPLRFEKSEGITATCIVENGAIWYLLLHIN